MLTIRFHGHACFGLDLPDSTSLCIDPFEAGGFGGLLPERPIPDRYSRVVCTHEPSSGEFRFTTFDTSREEMKKVVAKERPAVVIIEACLLAGWVRDLCDDLGVRCLVANTASEAWKFKHLKRKTDKDDALRLAQLYLLDQLPTSSHVKSPTGSIVCKRIRKGAPVQLFDPASEALNSTCNSKSLNFCSDMPLSANHG